MGAPQTQTRGGVQVGSHISSGQWRKKTEDPEGEDCYLSGVKSTGHGLWKNIRRGNRRYFYAYHARKEKGTNKKKKQKKNKKEKKKK